MIDDAQLQAFTEWAQTVRDTEFTTTDILLVEITTIDGKETCYGLMFVAEYLNISDQHCNQCMEEILPITCNAYEEFPYMHSCISIGTIKYDKIKSGEIKLPDNIKIIKRMDV